MIAKVIEENGVKSLVSLSGNPAEYSDIYSTAEIMTNKIWVDGKPIYRKTYTMSAGITLYEEHWLDSSYGVPAADISLFDTIVDAKYVGVNNNGPLTMNHRDSHWYVCALNSSPTHPTSNAGDYVVLEYTKA